MTRLHSVPTQLALSCLCSCLESLLLPLSARSFSALLAEPAQVVTMSLMTLSQPLSTVGTYSARIMDTHLDTRESSSCQPRCPLCESRAVNWASATLLMVYSDRHLRNSSLTGEKLRVRGSAGVGLKQPSLFRGHRVTYPGGLPSCQCSGP